MPMMTFVALPVSCAAVKASEDGVRRHCLASTTTALQLPVQHIELCVAHVEWAPQDGFQESCARPAEPYKT